MDTIHILFISSKREQFVSFTKVAEVKQLSYTYTFASSLEDVKENLTPEIDVVIVDYWIEGGTAMEILPLFPPHIPSIVLADTGSDEHIVQSMNKGAHDFIVKDDEERYIGLLPLVVRKVLRYRDVNQTHADIIKMSEKRYENLVQAIPDVVYKLDPKGYFTFVNNSVRMLGYEPEDLIGKHFTEILKPDDANRVSRREVLKEYRGKTTGSESAPKLFDERRCGPRKTTSLEIQLKKKHAPENPEESEKLFGSIIAYGEVSATGQYRRDEERRFFVGTVGIIRDITTRMRSEQNLRKLFQAVEQSPVSILIFDGRGKIDYVNPYFLRSTRYSPGELIGNEVSILKSPSISKAMYKEIRNTLEKGDHWIGEMACPDKEGGEIWAHTHVSPVINKDHETTHFLVIAEEIPAKP